MRLIARLLVTCGVVALGVGVITHGDQWLWSTDVVAALVVTTALVVYVVLSLFTGHRRHARR